MFSFLFVWAASMGGAFRGFLRLLFRVQLSYSLIGCLPSRGNREMELRAELTGRDGQKRPMRVRCEPEGELRGLLSGLAQLREQVAALLGPLVQQESGGGDPAASGGDEDEQDEDEEDNHVNAKACPVGPPLKRKKTHS